MAVPDGTYVLHTERSRFGFRGKAFMLVWVTGTVKPTPGSVQINDGKLAATGTADARSVDTRLAPRNWHLRTSHYLGVKKHPEIRLEVDGDTNQVEARLEARSGVATVPLDIEAIEAVGEELRITATGSFDRSPLGMLPPLAGVSKELHLNLEVVAKRTGA